MKRSGIYIYIFFLHNKQKFAIRTWYIFIFKYLLYHFVEYTLMQLDSFKTAVWPSLLKRCMQIPDLQIKNYTVMWSSFCVKTITDLSGEVFPICMKRDTFNYNMKVKEINDQILNSLVGHLHELRSANNMDNENIFHTVEDVQLIHQAIRRCVLDHVLRLKVASVCLIMRNLNIS